MASFKLHFLAALTLLLRSVVGQTTTVDYCINLEGAIEICASETPGFTDLPDARQASCLCASQLGTIRWGPSSFDLLAAKCASQYATIDVTIASDAAQLAGFCTTAAAGPTGTGVATNTATATPSVTLQTSPMTTAINTRPSTTAFGTSPGTSSNGAGGTTIISVVTASQSSATRNAAAHAQGRFDLVGLALPVGGMLLGGL